MKLYRVFFFLLAFFIVISSTCQAESSKPKIAVFDFQVTGSGIETENPGAMVAEGLLSAFADDGRFEIVERWRLNGVLEERFLGKSTRVDDNMAAKIGREISARIMISGSVLKLKNRLEIDARIINVERVNVTVEEYVKGGPNDDLRDLVNRLSKIIIGKFPLRGVVVDIDGRNITIDLGRRVGAKKDMQFIVYQRGKAIHDPKTDAIINYKIYRIGTIELVEIKEKTANGIVLDELFPGAIKRKHKIREIWKEDISSTNSEPGDVLKTGRHKIAVFPWRLRQKASSTKSILIDTYSGVIKNSKWLTLKASYYDHPQIEVKKIKARVFDGIEYSSNSAGHLKKDEVKGICALGAKLGVDAILLGKMSAKKLPSDMLEFQYIYAYLIHVETGRIFEVKKKSIRAFARDVLPGVLQEVVGQYENEFFTASD